MTEVNGTKCRAQWISVGHGRWRAHLVGGSDAYSARSLDCPTGFVRGAAGGQPGSRRHGCVHRAHERLLSTGCVRVQQVASWAVGGAGGAAWVRCGAAPNTAVSLSPDGRLQWWDLAMLRVRGLG